MSGAAQRSIVVHTPPEKLYAVIIDYERYPEFVPNMVKARLVRRDSPSLDSAFQTPHSALSP